MRTLLSTAILILCFSAYAAGPPTAVNGEWIVILRTNNTHATIAGKHGASIKRLLSRGGNHYGFAGRIPPGRLKQLQDDPGVRIVEPEQVLTTQSQTIPTGVRRIGATNSTAAKIDGVDERVNADIAIIDTGIQLDHPDLNVVGNVTFVAGTTSGNDDYGHGTHVAGIAAALDNTIGVVGVAPGARLWAVKVLGSGGSGNLSDIIAGVDWVTDHASTIEVANMSLGGTGTSDALRAAIQNCVAAGVVVVVAAGNSSFEVLGADLLLGTWDDFFPAAYPECMTVSALNDSDGITGGIGTATAYGGDDTLATYSNFSTTDLVGNPVNAPGALIDVAAPGTSIYSTYTNSSYAILSGTSMAAPHVSGAVALYCAVNGRATNAAGVYAIRQFFIDHAEPQTSWGPAVTQPYNVDQKYEGLVNVTNLTSTNFSTGTMPSPVLTITSPPTGTNSLKGASITFSAVATNSASEDASSGLSWFSTMDGAIGSGSSFATTNLSAGTHQVTASFVNTNGSPVSKSVSITITNSPAAQPQLSCTVTTDRSSYSSSAKFTLSSTGSSSAGGSAAYANVNFHITYPTGRTFDQNTSADSLGRSSVRGKLNPRISGSSGTASVRVIYSKSNYLSATNTTTFTITP